MNTDTLIIMIFVYILVNQMTELVKAAKKD